MSNRKSFSFGFAFCALMLGACQPATRFEWGTYEPALYSYYKSPSDRAQYQKALVNAIAQGHKTGKVAPGLCAELGYLQLEDGSFDAARASFEEEMRLFPESRQFLTGVIQRMTPAPKVAGAAS